MEVDGDGATSVGLLDVLIYVVPHLSSAAQLATLACVCKESAALVSADASWTVICEREWRVITSQLAPRSFSQWRELFRALKARNTPVTTVLAFAASVSSVDRPEESPARTLRPSLCYEDEENKHECLCSFRPCYWSSQACPTPDKDEWIVYGCVSPCVVIGIQIAAYEAFWQEHNAVVPIYWPRRVALSVSEGPSGEKDARRALGEWAIPQGAGRAAQSFALPEPVLVTSGYLRVELIGAREGPTYPPARKMQRQTIPDADDYYVCLNFVHVGGIPLFNFFATPAAGGKITLKGPWDDPCAVCGEQAADPHSCCARGRFCCADHADEGRLRHPRRFHVQAPADGAGWRGLRPTGVPVPTLGEELD